ncbi:MAG: hypothetical protein K0R46_2136 [Herbinix sp.]|jgi:hypothetical protein|nr:hypothetical protein [Herbinix sp.]
MKFKERKIIRLMIGVILCAVVLYLLYVLWEGTAFSNRSEQKQLQEALIDKEQLIDYSIEDDRAYVFVSSVGDKVYGDLFLVLGQGEKGRWNRLYENDFTGLKPWKIELADIDGDGVTELLTSVRKTTYYDKEDKNRLFIFNYIDGQLVKKWTGSAIAGTWENFIAGELVDTKGEELIFLSTTKEGKKNLFLYHWFDFGFLLLARSEDYEDIIKVEIVEENRLRMTYIQGMEKSDLFMLKKGQLTKVER